MATTKGTACIGLAVACLGTALANDANLSVGGTPKLMSGHATVRMEREKIVMTIGEATTTVVCDFWFKNDGPACAVRMGFPDEGSATEELDPSGKVSSNFDTFKSWVDGRSVQTKLVAGEGEAWHVKAVRFGAHALVHVRDTYESKTGSGIASAGDSQGGCLWAEYTVHTGSSWKGSIGKTEILVTFKRELVPHRLKLLSARLVGNDGDGRALKKGPFPKAGTIVWRGVSKPTVRGRTLRFLRTNWRPSDDDDLNLWFGFGRPTG